MRVVIAGGGIAGLSIAWAMRKRDRNAQIVLLERQPRTGGNIRTERIDGYLCESGPDGFLDSAPDTLRLVRELGLESRLQPSTETARRRFIVRDGRLHEVPASPRALLMTPLLSARGKARIALEPLARRRPDADESIHDFAARRIGEEAAAILVDAMVSGIFAGNPHALSLRACFPRMWQIEEEYGGLFRALLATARSRRQGAGIGAPAGRLTSFTNGMNDLIDALTTALGPIVRTSSPVLQLRKCREEEPQTPATAPARYIVATAGGRIDADAVVLAGPARESACLIREFDPTLAGLLEGIPTAPLAVVSLGYEAAALERSCRLDGFGFLVPRGEQVRILGALWETSIYPGRAPSGKALLRVMVGGACDPGAVALDDEQLLAVVRLDLERIMGVRFAPEFVRIIRHSRGIPQYVKGHLERLQQIGTLLEQHPGLHLAGNSYRGVSINACVAEADQVAGAALGRVPAAA
jgi:oxygen-dependent protoporphyrinogen oxidase